MDCNKGHPWGQYNNVTRLLLHDFAKQFEQTNTGSILDTDLSNRVTRES